ncbi:MAG: hypothetical protein ACOZAR_02615 [Patescibacteria group bacterium]
MISFWINYYSHIKQFVRNIFFLTVVLYLGSLTNTLQSYFFIDQELLLSLAALLFSLWLVLIFEQKKTYYQKNYLHFFKVIFLFSLFIIFLSNSNIGSGINWLLSLKEIFINNMYYLYILSTLSGFFLLYFSENQIENELGEEQKYELDEKTSNNSGIYGRVKSFLGIFSWPHLVIFLLVFGLAIYFRWPKDAPIQTMHDVYAAKWITERILPISDSGVMYWRAFPFSYSLAAFMFLEKIFYIANDFLIKLPVSFFSILSFGLIYLILKEFSLSKRILFWTMLLLALSSWSITYAHYIRFFSMMMACTYFSILTLIYFIKSEKNYWLFLSSISAVVAFLIEKPSYLLLVVFFYFLLREILKVKRLDTKIIKLIVSCIFIFFMSVVAVVISKPILPEKFIQANEKIMAAKTNIVSQIKFDQYNVKLLVAWYPYVFIFMWPFLIYLHLPKQLKKNQAILVIFAWSLFALSFLGVSKNTPRNLGFFADILPILLVSSAEYLSKALKNKLFFYFSICLIFFGMTNGIYFFANPVKSGDEIPYGPIRISNAKTFTNVHDMSLGKDFVKDYMKNNPDTIIVSTHSAAWENYYLAPYKVSYILNDMIADSLTTVSIGDDTYTLYEGLEIISLDEMLSIAQKNNILLITNYDFDYRLKPESIEYFQNIEPIFISDQDDRVKAYEFISPLQLFQ